MPDQTKPSRRVAILSNHAFSVVNFRLPLMRDIAARGHQVFALAPDFDAETVAALAADGITALPVSLSRTGLNPVTDLRDLIAMVRALKPLQLDTVLSFAIKPVIYGSLAARWAGIPNRYALIAGLGYAFGADQGRDMKRRTIHNLAKIMYRTSLGQVDRVFMQNPDDVDDFVRMNIVSRDKMVLVDGTGVAMQDWPELPPVTEPTTFLLAARLLGEKGIHDYVAAARAVKAQAPGARFVLLGALDSNPNGIARQDVEGWVEEGVIEWPGHVDVRPWLAQTSIYVLPSYYREGIPRSIQEALASGKPIITTDAPGCRETVIPGQNGYLVRPRDPAMIADAMLNFIRDPQMIVRMGRQSRVLAEKRFDVKRINRQMIDAMEL